MDLGKLIPGEKYVFSTSDWEGPDGGLISGTTKVLVFVERRIVRALGLPATPFVEVARADGSTYLIAEELISSATPA